MFEQKRKKKKKSGDPNGTDSSGQLLEAPEVGDLDSRIADALKTSREIEALEIARQEAERIRKQNRCIC